MPCKPRKVNPMSRSSDAATYTRKCMEKMKGKPEPPGQKYHVGERVMIAKDLGPMMRHFPKGKAATVMYTYAHMYGGDNIDSYSLDVDGIGEISWYEEWQLSSIVPQARKPTRRFLARKGKPDLPISPTVRPGGARRLDRIERAKAQRRPNG